MEFLDRRRVLVEDRLEEVVERLEPPALREAVDHATLSGGKRVRPTVTLLSCETIGGEPGDAVDYAAGVELVHTASLVVDDVIDRSPMRRGASSSWLAHGHGPAIVTSDGLLGEAFALFAADAEATRTVSEALVELGVGEASELTTSPATETEYETLARRKTGSLFRAAAELGAIAADGDPVTVEALGEYAARVGVAFQLRDDVLDAVTDADELGKPTGHDAAIDRPSVLRVTDLSPEAATERARRQADLAIESLETVEVVDPRAEDYLRELARFVVERER